MDFLRALLLLGIAGSAVTMIGSAAAWWLDEERRLRRYMVRALRGEPDAAIFALGRNAAAGFRLESGHVMVMWNGGARALLYRIDALEGAELIVDDHVAGRVYRGEPRRALDHVDGGARRVTLRLIFNDPRDPDFDLDLWLPEDQSRRNTRDPAAAIQEARTWLARADALLRRPATPARIQSTTEEEDDPPSSEEDDDAPF